MFRLCGSPYVLITILAATTFVVIEGGCNGNCRQDPPRNRNGRRSKSAQYRLFGPARRVVNVARRYYENENYIKDTTKDDENDLVNLMAITSYNRKSTLKDFPNRTPTPNNDRNNDDSFKNRYNGKDRNDRTDRNEHIERYIRKEPNHTKSRRKCCPYDFDSHICKVVDDRLLCGFNKNVGNPKSNNTAVHMHGDCKLRGGRIECGYDNWPYRRDPPIVNRPPHYTEPAPKKEPEIRYPHTEIVVPVTTGYPELVTRCVEIDNRIVCRKV